MPIQYLLKCTNITLFLLVILTTGKAFSTTESSPNSINFSVIKEYAGFSNATYKTETQIREFSSLKKYTLTHYSNIPEIEISYFLATNDTAKTQIIAVRGTSNIENAIVDIALKLTPDKLAGVRIHNGFSQAAQAIYKEIKPQLKTDYVISTTGHSLGGAVALILAMYLDIDKFNIGQVITFGQPKVTNIGGANKFQGLNIIRVVTPKDLVPLVPPLDPVDINNIDIYWHLGKEVLLLPENTYAILEGMSSMLRATRFTQEPLNENNLANHQMSLYLQLIDKKITHSKQVPFKNSLNLFNLFGSEEK